MLIANKYEIPDSCPTVCPFLKESFYQGNMCTRCPVFNCRGFEDSSEYADDDGKFRLLKPEDYREDWAEIWFEWFKGDMKTYPELPLFVRIKGENN